jgi:putative transposase
MARKPRNRITGTTRRPEPVRWHFGRQDRVSIYGEPFRVVESSDAGHIFARVNNPDDVFPVTHEEMEEIRRDHRFRHERNFFDRTRARTVMQAGVAFMRDLPKDDQDLINWKADVCKRFLELEARGIATRGDDSVRAAIEIIARDIADARAKSADGPKRTYAGREEKTYRMPCAKHLIRWANKLIAAGMNPLALRNRRDKRGNREPRLTPDAYAILYDFALKFATPEKLSIAELHRQMVRQFEKINEGRRLRGKSQLQCPSEDRLGKEIAQIPAFHVMAGRESVEAAIAYFRSVDDGMGDLVQRPLQRVEMDEWTVHLHVLAIRAKLWDKLDAATKEKVKRVRMVLGAAIDCASRCLVAMRLTRTPSSENAVAMIDMMVSDKTSIASGSGATTPWEMHGTPELVCTDIGTSYANDVVRSSFADLQVTFDHPSGGAPFLRGTIERVFRTADQKLISRFPGRTFSHTVAKGSYDSHGRAGLTVEDLAEALVRWCVDIYHNTPHSGLGGNTPRARWLELTAKYPPTPPPDQHLRRTVFGIELTATLEPKGLRCLGGWYRSRELQAYFEKRGHVDVLLRVDPKDLGWVSVKVDGDWLTVPGPMAFRGMSAAVWIVIRADIRRRNVNLAKLTRPTVAQAEDALMRLDEKARQRAGIADSPISPAALERAHRMKNLGVEFIDDEEPETGSKGSGLFARAVMVRKAQTSGVRKPSPGPAASAKPHCRRRAAKPRKASPTAPWRRRAARKGWTIED